MLPVPRVSPHRQVFANIEVLRANSTGLASAGFMMAFFGAAWWGWGVGGMQGLFHGETVAFFLILALATLLLMSGGTLLSRAASRLPHETSPGAQPRSHAEGKRYGRIFGVVFGVQMVSIALGSMLLNRFHHLEFLLPFVSLVVGAHFFPLARLFAVRLYYATGALLILTSVTVVLAVPVDAMIGNLHAWNALVGLLCAAILWLTGISALLRGRRFLKQAQGAVGAV